MKGKKGIQRILTALFIILCIIITGSKVTSAAELIETSTLKIRKTAITWDSSFHDYNYPLGSTIKLTVAWTVDKGTATYNDFLLDKVNPTDKKDPVMGEFVSDPINNPNDQGGEVKIEFRFTDLHLDVKRNVEIGNAHFKLVLNVDKNGDGTPESVVEFGVNVHVERGADENIPPVADAGDDQTHTLEAGQTQMDITLNGSGSSDVDGTIASYTWTGTPDPADTETPSVTLSAGTYTFALVVTDDDGEPSSSDTVTVTINAPNMPLAMTITSPTEGQVVGVSPIVVQGTVSDPDARVIVQNVIAEVVGTTFEAEGITLVEGLNQLEAHARNDADEEAAETRAVILDTTPPSLTITSPSERSLFTNPSVTIYGIVADATGVSASIDGEPVTITGGSLSGTATLAAGQNVLAITCQDAAGNTTTEQLTLYLDTEPLSVTAIDPVYGASDVPTSTVVTVTFSEPVKSASLNSSTFFIRNGAAIVPADLTVSSDALTATLTPTGELLSGATIDVTLTQGITDATGIPLPTFFLSRFFTAGDTIEPGVVIGEVYDDTRSLPLEGATVAAIASDTGEELAQTQTDALGRYLLSPGQSDILVRITKPGFSPVDRIISAVHGSYAEAYDARLTPLYDPRFISAALGAEIQNNFGDVLKIPPGAVATDGNITFTPISQQGPRVQLPAGWAPLAIVQIDSPQAFDPPASLSMVDRSKSAQGKDAVFARYDESENSWLALANITIQADGSAEFGSVAGPGQFALLLKDLGEGAPDSAIPNAPLPSGTSLSIPEYVEAVGTVTPSVGRADDPAPANATVTITSDTPLRSATPLRGDFLELFVLTDGDRISPLDTSQDLFAYRDPDDPEGLTLKASFPIAPSRLFGLGEITEGTITVTLHRSATISRSLVGPAGGGLQTDDGSRVIIPAGAFLVDIPIDLHRLNDDIFEARTPQGFTYLGGLELDISGVTAAIPLSLTLGDTAWRVPTGSRVVVAQLQNVQGREKLIPVGMANIQGDDLTIVTEVDGATFPGIRTGGVYCFYRYDGELAVVSGTARDENRRDGLVIEVENMPFVSVTDTNGNYTLISQPGPYILLGTGASNLDQVRIEGQTGVPLPEVVVTPTPPSVERITVRLPKVEGNFAGPVVLLGNPAPLIDDDTTGESSGNSDGGIDAGERIELFLFVRNEGTVPVENISFGLRIRGPEGTIEVLPELLSMGTIPPDEPIEIGPFVFEIPTGTDVSLLSFMLSSLGAQNVSNQTFFKLPLDVDHPDVPVDSEVTVYFSEPVVAASLGNALLLEREDNSGLTPVSTKLVVSEDGATAKLRPVETLADDAVYRITLTESVVDRDGRPLANAPVMERFRTVDLTPPGPIDPGSIEASFPDEEGFVTITGSLGSVNPDDSVIVLNETTGFVVLAEVEADGSFSARIYAELTDRIVLMVQDRDGNETTIDPGPFVQRDPVTGEILSVVIGHNGGIVQGPEGIQLIVPVGALIDATEIKLSRDETPFALPADISDNTVLVTAFESFFEVFDRVKIEGDARQFSGSMDLSLTPPPDAVEGDLFVVVQNQTVTLGGPLADLDTISGLTAAENPLKEVVRLEMLETATVKNQGGELILSTDSPPFKGITEPGTLTILKVNGSLVFLAGEVRRNTVDGLPVSGAMVQTLPDSEETSAFAAVTAADGSFVVADSSLIGTYEVGAVVSSRLDVFDPDFLRTIRRDVRGAVGSPAPPDTVVAHLEQAFVLPEKLPGAIIDVLGDLEPPEVNIYAEGVSLENGFSRAGDPITVTVIAKDNDEVAFLSLEVDQGAGFKAVSLSANGIYTMTPLVDALITFRVTARDASGNSGFAETSMRTVSADPGEPLIPGPLSGRAPVRMDPPSAPPSDPEEPSGEAPELTGGDEISFDGDIVLYFSEPLDTNTINKDSVQLKDPEDQAVDVDEPLPEANGTVIRIVPKRYLRLGACYTIHLSASIMDLEGKNIKEENIPFKVPQPLQLAWIGLKNTRDIVLAGDTLVVANHPDGMGMTDFGEIHAYQTKDEEGRVLSKPILLSSKQVNGRPVSLAEDCGLVFVGNHYLGSLASRELVFNFSFFSSANDFSQSYNPDTTIGAFPLPPLLEPSFLDLLGIPNPLFLGLLNPYVVSIGFTSIPVNFPFPSNLGVYDISDPKNMKHVGNSLINYHSKELPAFVWNPNASVYRVEVTDQGVAVLNFLDNIEIFTSDVYPQSLGVVERIHSPGQFAGRCENVYNDLGYSVPCVQDVNWPPSYVFPPNPKDCLRTSCLSTDEFLDAAFFNGFAVILVKGGIRVFSTKEEVLDVRVNPDRTLSFFPMPGSFLGRLGGVPDFEWWDSKGVRHETNLVFVAGQTDNRLTIFDMNDPKNPRNLSELENSYGNMSFDSCLGLAYIRGRNGEFHIVDFNDPENPRELNNPGGGEAFRVAGLGSGVSPDGNTNSDGVIYLSNRPGFAIVQMKRCAKIGNDCGSDVESSDCTSMMVNPKPFSRATCEKCPGVLDIEMEFDDEDRILGISSPPDLNNPDSTDDYRHSLKLSLSLADSYSGSSPVKATLTQSGVGKVAFRNSSSSKDMETIEVELERGNVNEIEVFGKNPSRARDDTSMQVSIKGSACDSCNRVWLTVVGVDLDVDSDNNLKIEEKEDEYEEEPPGFEFWVNEGRSVWGKDSKSTQESKIRNLENFSTVKMTISTIEAISGKDTTLWLPEGYKIYLEMQKAGDSEGSPEIRIVKKAGKDLEYLSDEDTAKEQVELVTNKAVGSVSSIDEPMLLDLTYFDSNSEEFLFDVGGEGEAILRLILKAPDGETIISQDEVLITLKKLRQMYTMAYARPVPIGSDVAPTKVYWPVETEGFSGNSELKRDSVLVFVHGYNVTENAAYKTFDDVFRRFYWTGLTNPKWEIDDNEPDGIKEKGTDFIGLTWYGNQYGFGPKRELYYNANVFNAFEASKPVGVFLKEMSVTKKVDVMAHSLGNMVISNAIKKVDDIGIKKYVLHQAAVTANAYDVNGVIPHYLLVKNADEWGYPDDYHWIAPFNSFLEISWPEPRWTQNKYLDNGIGDPWGDYFSVVPNRVTMINTFSEADPVLGFKNLEINAWMKNQEINRPDIVVDWDGPWGMFDRWNELPDSLPDSYGSDDRREWAELSYYFGAVAQPAGVTKIYRASDNIDGRPMGIDSHSAFKENAFYDVWEFWETVAKKLNPEEGN